VVDEHRSRAWQALGIGPAWVVRSQGSTGVSRKESTTASDAAPPVDEFPDWATLETAVAGCTRCALCEGRTNVVFGAGARDARWMLVGEAPGEDEDASGEPFVGQAGKLLDRMLAALGLDRSRDVFIANVLKCRPPRNRDPLAAEVARCEPYLARQVALLRPQLIVALGRVAAQSMLKSDAGIGSLRSRVHRYRAGDVEVPLIVTYHPAYLLRTPSDKARAWADLCLARATLAQGTQGAPDLPL
jgi:uracil-DNA glycosylase